MVIGGRAGQGNPSGTVGESRSRQHDSARSKYVT